MKSMTGYGKAQEQTFLGLITVELVSVNHRNLDIRLKLPESCRVLEIDLRGLVKKTLRRGHLDGFVKIERDEAAVEEISLNLPMATAYFNEITKLHEALNLDAPVDISWILGKPDVWQSPPAPETEQLRTALLPVFEEALRALNRSREQEGAALKRFFENKLREIESVLKEIEAFMPRLPHLVKESLSKKLAELQQDPSLNPDRLAQEVAYLAQRADIAEEVSRFGSHLKAFREKIAAPEVSGRELDFTVQEMNREVNTMGSKSVAYDLSARVIRLKELLNQIREQVQNVE